MQLRTLHDDAYRPGWRERRGTLHERQQPQNEHIVRKVIHLQQSGESWSRRVKDATYLEVLLEPISSHREWRLPDPSIADQDV